MITYKFLIDGRMTPGALEMPVLNPATEDVIGFCPRANLEQLNEAVASAKAAFPAWSALPIADRCALIERIADVIDANREELACLLTAESGKPLSDAKDEITWMASFYRFFAAHRLELEVLEDSGSRRIERRRRPLGVVAAIVPWNYPMSISALKVPAALVAGNTCILKPAPTTPLGTLRFADLICDVLPPGVLNVIVDANDLGDALTSHPDVRKVSFTGSTTTGRKVMSSAAATLKRLTLELGGNDPAIVLDDADPKAAAAGIFASAFVNSGQVCFAIKRVYAHEAVYDAVCDELAELAKHTVVDDGMKQGTKLGPLQNKAQFDKVKQFLQDAHKNGTVIAGGKAMGRPGYFVEATIVRDIQDGSRLVDEEQFGPVLPIVRFSQIDDVVRRANSSEFGLGASVWSSDIERARDIAARIDAGTVWVNKHLELPPHIPFGGAKQSGIGVEFGDEGLAEFTQAQIINS